MFRMPDIRNVRLLITGLSGTLLFLSVFSACRPPRELVYRDVQHFSVRQAAQNKTLLSMDIRLYNPNPYAMKLKSADVDVFVNGSNLGKLTTSGQPGIIARDTFSLPVTLEVDLRKVLPNVLQLFVNSEVDIKLNGRIKAGRHGVYVNIPVTYEGRQDIMDALR